MTVEPVASTLFLCYNMNMDSPVPIETYLLKGWKLSEFTNWISYKEKDDFLYLLGPDNLILLDEADSKFQKKWKAKMLISPIGMDILNLYFMPPLGNA